MGLRLLAKQDFDRGDYEFAVIEDEARGLKFGCNVIIGKDGKRYHGILQEGGTISDGFSCFLSPRALEIWLRRPSPLDHEERDDGFWGASLV